VRVKLKVKNTEDVREFEKAHALRILRLPNSVFELADDSQFEFTDNELRRKKDKATDRDTDKKGGSKRGRKSSK
jgi:hypothetical protein